MSALLGVALFTVGYILALAAGVDDQLSVAAFAVLTLAWGVVAGAIAAAFAWRFL